MSDFIPAEVVTDILLRLPVEPLLRFRCVCKTWCALIDSPSFIKLHLKTSLQSTNYTSHLTLFLGGTAALYSLNDFASDHEINAVELRDHPLNFDKIDPTFRVLGSANGLLCLGNMFRRQDIAVWNPSTRKHIMFPTPPLPVTYPGKLEFLIDAFGHDVTTDDYKVVRVGVMLGKTYGVVSVCSLKRKSWRRVCDFPNYLNFQLDGPVVACGCVHWVVRQTLKQDAEKLVYAFDLGTEEYRVVPQPEVRGKSLDTALAVLGGSLVLCDYQWPGIDLWVMREYGVKESWTKLASIVPSKEFELQSATPMMLSEDGREVLLEVNHEKFVWYNVEKKTFRSVNTRGTPVFFFAHVCVGSLVPLSTDKEVLEKGKEKNRVKKKDDFLSKGFKLKL